MSCKLGGFGEGPNCKIRPLCEWVISQTLKGKEVMFQESVQIQPSRQLRLGPQQPLPSGPKLPAEGGHHPAQAGACQSLHHPPGSLSLLSKISGSGKWCCLCARPGPVRCARQEEAGGVGGFRTQKACAWVLAVVCGSCEPFVFINFRFSSC